MSDQKRQDKINASLQEFLKDSVAFMNQHPAKMDADGEVVEGCSLFSEKNVEQMDYIAIRDGFRAMLSAGEDMGTRAAFQSNDLAQNLVDELRYKDLESMESADLTEASLGESPWSDDYWALYTGVLGKRYADPAFPASSDWKENYDYIAANRPDKILQSGSASKIDRLSPSEKYDALVGDKNYSLTRAMWAEGQGYYEQYGEVESWMGICHGWAPAAYMLDRPQKAIKVRAADGTTITFYPADIKALASLLWAKVMPRTKFIGGRCNEKEPAQDENGRVTSQEGFDTNPGTWHMSVVNQIGHSKRSVVLDVTYDYEVWNQPIHAYTYRYFNTESFTYANSLAEAKVPMSGLSNDRFSKYRSSNARSLVGIHMELAYVVETDPTQNTPDTPENDLIQKVDYYYDLELDANDEIIGGEWYMNKHPDFLWTPNTTAKAVTRFDAHATGSWAANESVPAHWQNAAKQASISDSSPLAAIVERLIELSRQ